MKNIFYTLLNLSIAFSLLSSCSKEINVVDLSYLKGDTLINIPDWKILSSFYLDTLLSVETATNYNYLEKYGVSEFEIYSLNYFESISEKIVSEDDSKIFQSLEINRDGLNISDFAEKKEQSAIYLATNINTTDSVKAVLNLSAYQSAVIYLNGENIYNISWKKGRTFFREDYVPISLKKGTNFILVKVILSDPNYAPSNWFWQADISCIRASKDIYLQSYSKFFLRRSLVNKSENLDIYLGPFIHDNVKVSIYKKKHPNKRITFKDQNVKTKEGITSIELSSHDLSDGLYICEIVLDKTIYEQDFFLGDIDLYAENLWENYNKFSTLTPEYRLDFEGIKHRLYLLARREPRISDDLAEHWNRIRIPSLINLEQAINNYKIEDIEPYFFLRNYYSEYWKGYYSYSVYYPKNKVSPPKKPVFIHLIDSEQEVRDWRNHYINYMSRNLSDTEMIADELDFISVWTDCGGRKSDIDRLKLFKEIYNDILTKYNVDKNRVFIVGNCASTNFVFKLAQQFSSHIFGIGLINPDSYTSSFFENSGKYNQIISMVYAGYDNIITQETYNNVFDNIQKVDPYAHRFSHIYSTHYNTPYNYSKPIYEDLLIRSTHSN